MDLEFSPSILNTPSLMTPNINTNPLIFKSSYTTTTIDVNNDNNNNNNNNSSSNPSSIITTTTDESLSVSSAEIKLSKIEYDLKQSFTTREPTETPFRKFAASGSLIFDKNISIPSTTDDSIPVEIPSTAEVMNVIESLAKNLGRDNSERETTATLTSDISRLDTSSTHPMVVIVSPKKKLLIRSQSHTEPTSPISITNNQFSQSQKLNLDDENSIDDNHFQRLQDLPILTHTIDSNQQIDNDLKPSYPIQLRTDQNGLHQTLIKQQQQPTISNNKRTFQQTVIGAPIPKTSSILIHQNEVSSTGQLLNVKRQKMTPIPTHTINVRSSTNDDNIGNDDQRKKQIRDSNREAARRCRERRRNYIEQLEGNLEQCKLQIKQLNEKLTRAERENNQLRTIITETKIFHPSSRLSSNESIVDFANVIGTNGIDLNSETTDGNALQRNYINRNTH